MRPVDYWVVSLSIKFRKEDFVNMSARMTACDVRLPWKEVPYLLTSRQ